MCRASLTSPPELRTASSPAVLTRPLTPSGGGHSGGVSGPYAHRPERMSRRDNRNHRRIPNQRLQHKHGASRDDGRAAEHELEHLHRHQVARGAGTVFVGMGDIFQLTQVQDGPTSLRLRRSVHQVAGLPDPGFRSDSGARRRSTPPKRSLSWRSPPQPAQRDRPRPHQPEQHHKI